MTQLIKGVALFVTVTCFVWVAVLWRWDTTSRAMSVDDIVVYLGLLPLVVFVLLLALRWAWRSAAARQAAAAAAVPAVPAGSTAAALPNAEQAERHATVHMLAAHAMLACGSSMNEILSAVKDGKPRPELDKLLRDADGLAVVCARIVELTPDDLAESLERATAAVRARQPEFAAHELPERARRALAALAEPLTKALGDLAPWHARLGVDRDGQAPPQPQGTVVGVLRVLVGWPLGWSEFTQAVGSEWVRSLLADGQATPIPPARVRLRARAVAGTELWLDAERLLHSVAREKREDLVLVAACHSDLDDAGIELLDQQQRLFSAQRRPKGVMPGEAAVALLLAPSGWPDDPAADEPPVLLHRAAVLQRDKSVEHAGRISSLTLAEAAQQALSASRVPPADIAALVCDADQHTARGTELFGVSLELLAQLDAVEDMRLTGTLTGHLGAASVLLVVGAAAALARELDKPCLALALGDPTLRLALVARTPPTPAPDAAQDAAPASPT
jgi:hypothetical protein